MSHVSQATQLRTNARSHWIAALSALLALMATAAVVLVLVIDGGSDASSSVSPQSQSVAPSQSGPDESAVAASIGSRPATGPDESAVAASIAPQPSAGPDENRTATSVRGSASPGLP